MTEITNAKLEEWERIVHPHGAPNWESLHRDDCRRLIAEVRRLRAEIQAIKEQQEIKKQVEMQMLRNKLSRTAG